MSSSDKRSPERRLAERRGTAVPVRAGGGSAVARWPVKQIDAETRRLIDKEVAKRGGRR